MGQAADLVTSVGSFLTNEGKALPIVSLRRLPCSENVLISFTAFHITEDASNSLLTKSKISSL